MKEDRFDPEFGYYDTVEFPDGAAAGISLLTFGRGRIVHYRGWSILNSW
jgi:hypothetical protein